MALLAVDLGGTKTLLQLSSEQGDVLLEVELTCQHYESFDTLLTAFFALDNVKGHKVKCACFAVAGPVNGDKATITNLPWIINASAIARKFAIEKVLLCNDFEAIGYGIETLKDDDLLTLQQSVHSHVDRVRAVIGAGTGLGQAILISSSTGWQVLPTEGGNVDFGPTDSKQILFLEYMMQRFGHVSYERILSGPGLVAIYDFLRGYLQKAEDPDLRLAIIDNDPAAVISLFANKKHDQLACEALSMFFQIYGAQTANLALTCLPLGGIYIAGGIAAKNLSWFKNSQFLEAFSAKGKMQHLIAEFPVYVIKDTKVGLKGAMLLARQSVV